LQKIDPKYVSRIKIDTNICKCSNCNIEMTLYPSDGIQICENCGNQENILIESDKPSFKDPPLEVCYFSYKRINHYNEYIGQKVYINDFIKVIYKIIYFLIN
jgi:predicted amidophosphoribosyltransferase